MRFELDKSDNGRPRLSRRRFLQLAAGTALALCLPSCRRTGQESPLGPASGWTDTDGYMKDPPWRLARSGRGDVNPWMVMLSAHIEYAAVEAHRDRFAAFNTTSANWDPNKQIEDIEHLLEAGADVLLIDPMDTVVVARGVQRAMDAGVPVILVASYLSRAPYVSWVSQSEEARATTCVDWAIEDMGARRILVLSNTPASGHNALWLQSVQQRLGAHPHLTARFEPCHWSSAAARDATNAALSDGQAFDAVVVRDGMIARGAVEAFVARGLPIPPIAGADDWNGWLRTASEHGIRFLGLAGGANVGLRAVELAIQVLSGEPVMRDTALPLHIFDHTGLGRYYRPDLSAHYWAVHELPQAWIDLMFRP